jgi:CheY-like chemotaxis protein
MATWPKMMMKPLLASDGSLAFGPTPQDAASPLHAVAADAKEAPADGAPVDSPKGARTLEGQRILVVEDEFLLAMEVEATLSSFGCAVAGPFAKLGKALDAARTYALDGAVLDINLNGEMVYPLADLLHSLGVPFLFLTGYVASDIPERFRGFQRLQKPLHPYTLRKVLMQLLRVGG